MLDFIHRALDVQAMSGRPMTTTQKIFVFGSNLAGRHGKGAALHARKHYGAIYGQGAGRQGRAYGIPTKDANLQTLPLTAVASHIDDFISYALDNPDVEFEVTRIGCGLAGYTDRQIAPLFQGCPLNCKLPDGWRFFEDTND